MAEDNNERLARIETEIGALQAGQADIKATLSQVMATLSQGMALLERVSADIGEIKGKIADAPTARELATPTG